MANIKTCSVRKVIAQFYRDFKPSNSGWVEDTIEWIGDAIDYMKVNNGYCETFIDLEVFDYRVKIPCQIDSLLFVEYKGCRLRPNGGIKYKERNCSLPYSNHTYKLNPNYIEPSFKEGCIRVHYLGLEVDCDGYPYVIDTAKYRDALMWYVLMKMIGRGFKHQTFNYQDAEQRWMAAYPKAQNESKQLGVDEMESWKHNWVGLVNNLNRSDNFFRSNGSVYTENSFPPGSLLQTFQIIGDKDEAN